MGELPTVGTRSCVAVEMTATAVEMTVVAEEMSATTEGMSVVALVRNSHLLLTDGAGDSDRQFEVLLRVDFRHIGPRVTEQHLGGLQPVGLPNPGREQVP